MLCEEITDSNATTEISQIVYDEESQIKPHPGDGWAAFYFTPAGVNSGAV
jgi:hypothetical protein